MTATQPACHIHQSACGRIPGDSICPKCGLDEHVRYVSAEARLLAVRTAEARYWQNHAMALAEQIKVPVLGTSPNQCYRFGQIFQDLPISPSMVVLTSSSFQMGSADDDPDGHPKERPQHKVTIAYKLAMGRYPVTFEEWDACVADGGVNNEPDDASWGRGKRPVINVSWDDAQAYIDWLNKKLGIDTKDPYRYRLPSEAEWEYACRAGTTGNFSTPNGQLGDGDATYNSSVVLENLSPKAGKKQEKTTPVGIYAPNPWGLYDMHGNVLEWVQDNYEDSYFGAPSDGNARTTGSAKRVLRGGSWFFFASNSRSAFRLSHSQGGHDFMIGFRLAKTEQ